MPANRRDFFGMAVGLDRGGSTRRIEVFKTREGLDFVSETLYLHHVPAARKLTPEQMRDEVAYAFGLREVNLEFPQFGIYASAAKPREGSSLSRRDASPRSRFTR
jgi:hypothetical protein